MGYGPLLALFAAGYAARYLPPQPFWWAEIVAVGLPYLSLLVVAATPFVLLLRGRRSFCFHAFALLLIGARFVSPASFRQAEAAPADVLRLMTFNTPYYWGGFDDAERGRRMRDLVEAERPHLIALQDAGIGYRPTEGRLLAGFYVNTLARQLGYRTTSPPSSDEVVYSRQPVFGKITVRTLSRSVLQVKERDRWATEVVRAQFVWQGRPAVLYNLHLRSHGEQKPWHEEESRLLRPRTWLPYLRQYRDAFRDRAWEARQIRAMIEKEELPVVVCGDFNSTPHNWVYRHLAASLNLRDAFKVAGRGWGATYHQRLPFARIDFVLAGPEWDVVEAHVAPAVLSDHRPLVVGLRWRHR